MVNDLSLINVETNTKFLKNNDNTLLHQKANNPVTTIIKSISINIHFYFFHIALLASINPFLKNLLHPFLLNHQLRHHKIQFRINIYRTFSWHNISKRINIHITIIYIIICPYNKNCSINSIIRI